jgi:hypothetical protein
MMPTIRIDDDVYSWLQKHARPFDDTPNTVLRRIAGLDSEKREAELRPSERLQTKKSENGSKTPQEDFKLPILKILQRHGGEADRLTVLRELEMVMKDRLTDFDKCDIRSGTIRWQKTAEWEVHIMRNQALLKPVRDTRPGVWALTDKGRKAAEESR